MTEEVNKSEALLRLYHCINGPNKAGPVWVTYSRSQIDASLSVIKQLLELEGITFKKEVE